MIRFQNNKCEFRSLH